jgi:hypothetical protein
MYSSTKKKTRTNDDAPIMAAPVTNTGDSITNTNSSITNTGSAQPQPIGSYTTPSSGGTAKTIAGPSGASTANSQPIGKGGVLPM